MTEATIPATCEINGKRVLTALAEYGGKTFTDSCTEALPALGHDWDRGEILQPEDGGEYVIRFTCQREASHTRVSPLNIIQPSKDYYYYTVHTSHPQNSDKDARFVVKRHGDDAATYGKFLGIAVDNRHVPSDCYVTFPGSVVIDIKASYLHTLAVGKHTMRTIFTDGYVDTSFTVTAENPPVSSDSPKTGEGSYAALWLMMAASMAAMIASLRRKKRQV